MPVPSGEKSGQNMSPVWSGPHMAMRCHAAHPGHNPNLFDKIGNIIKIVKGQTKFPSWKHGAILLSKLCMGGLSMKIVVLDGATLNPGDVSWQPVAVLGQFDSYGDTGKDDFAERVAGADVVLVNKVKIGAENLADLSACRLIGVLATGTNNLDLPALAEAGITACNVPAYGAEDVAQHAIALLMELARGTGRHTRSVLSGEWSSRGEWCYWLKTPLCLAGMNMGIVGFGTIGRVTGRIGAALGMKILAWSRSRKATAEYPFSWAVLDEIWEVADVISLHCPLTPQTEKLINPGSIAAMRDGTIIINTARGGLVDEMAVANALHNGKLGGFGCDVLSVEPPGMDNPLFSAPNVLITPHMAWASARARQKIIDITADNIMAFLAGTPQNVVNGPLVAKSL